VNADDQEVALKEASVAYGAANDDALNFLESLRVAMETRNAKLK